MRHEVHDFFWETRCVNIKKRRHSTSTPVPAFILLAEYNGPMRSGHLLLDIALWRAACLDYGVGGARVPPYTTCGHVEGRVVFSTDFWIWALWPVVGPVKGQVRNYAERMVLNVPQFKSNPPRPTWLISTRAALRPNFLLGQRRRFPVGWWFRFLECWRPSSGPGVRRWLHSRCRARFVYFLKRGGIEQPFPDSLAGPARCRLALPLRMLMAARFSSSTMPWARAAALSQNRLSKLRANHGAKTFEFQLNLRKPKNFSVMIFRCFHSVAPPGPGLREDKAVLPACPTQNTIILNAPSPAKASGMFPPDKKV